MKKRFLFTVIIIGIMTSFSLKAQFKVGPGVGYITETRSVMLTASANYDFPKNFGVMADFDYIFARTATHKWWGLDLDGTYTFDRKNERGKLYVLAGLNLLYQSYPGYNFNYTGANIGVGWRLAIGDKMELVPESKITIGELSYLRLGLKLMFGL
jgi:hypothetical protein